MKQFKLEIVFLSYLLASVVRILLSNGSREWHTVYYISEDVYFIAILLILNSFIWNTSIKLLIYITIIFRGAMLIMNTIAIFVTQSNSYLMNYWLCLSFSVLIFGLLFAFMKLRK